MSYRYQVKCNDCSLSHIWDDESDARRERNNHHLQTGHAVNVHYENIRGQFQ